MSGSFSHWDEVAVTYLEDDTSRGTSSFGNVDSIRILWVGVDGEDLGGQGDGVAIFVRGLGLSAFLFGDRIPLSPSLSGRFLLLDLVWQSLTRSGNSCRRLIVTWCVMFQWLSVMSLNRALIPELYGPSRHDPEL